MMSAKQWLLVMCFWCSLFFAQEPESLYQSAKWIALQDSVPFTSEKLNPTYFKVIDKQGQVLDSTQYVVDFDKNHLRLKAPTFAKDTLELHFLKLPDFLTKSYSFYDPERIVANEAGLAIYSFQERTTPSFTPFEGLTTSGSLTRGLTMGNNQNAVTNSNLDLQITGKLSDKVSIRASLQDSNVPLQNGGYSQKINEFDQIFMELFADNWSIKAGDIFLENRSSKFLNFNKKVQGLATKFTFGNTLSKTTVEAVAALARGQYAKSQFQGQEGNQGPYKLKGPQGELFILIISGSETVYVNGVALKRGENNDYVIDYNSGEIRFTTLYPITSDMRIAIEYQYTDRNYTRFVGYGNIQHERENWSFGGTVFTETDLKNQPLQQNLSKEQVTLLSAAGNDPDKMVAPSAYPDAYTENKIQYEKLFLENDTYYYEFSTNADAELYTVYFSLVGPNQGDYIIENNQSNGKIYKFTPPVQGIPQGNYAPVTKLIAPIRNTITTLNASYHPSIDTQIKTEFALSNSDQNLFSTIDNETNKGWATEIQVKQKIWGNKKIRLDAFADFQFISENFKSLENLYTIEFDRDWNLSFEQGNQSLLTAGLSGTIENKAILTYQIEHLKYGSNFTGYRHRLFGELNSEKWTAKTDNSVLHAEAIQTKTQFSRSDTEAKYHFSKNWIGSRISFENQEEKNTITKEQNLLNHRSTTFQSFIGRGDSLGVFTEIGWIHRINDSIQKQTLQKVSTGTTFYLKSKLIQNERRNLSFYINHRTLRFSEQTQAKEQTINSRATYNDRFFNGFIQTNTVYEISSGTIAQQEFTYLEVEPGQGVYMWIDYNNNGIQELEEFEIAPFPDQAIYVRLYLPNQIFVQTHQNKFSQAISLNPMLWQQERGLKKLLSLFYNQTSILLDRSDLRQGNPINLNPFRKENDQLVGLNQSLRNTLFYNRGKQQHSLSYTYIQTRTKNLLSFGTQENRLNSHQLFYNHLIKKSWLLSLSSKKTNQETLSNTYASKNYEIDSYSLEPKVSYLFTANTSLDFFYEYQQKENTINAFELLKQHRLGSSFQYSANAKFSLNGELSFYQNTFTGDAFSPVAYQMLEGLQPGKNFTWRFMLQKNLTPYLDLNVNYQGRTNESTTTIHTGNVQLRAFF